MTTQLRSLLLAAFLLAPRYVFSQSVDDVLKRALEKSNAGDSQAAIQELEQLVNAGQRDARLFQSLGLLYQSTGDVDRAQSNLEQAVALQALPESWYALGLLYESRWLTNKDNTDKQKALNSWDQFLKSAPPNHPRRFVGEKHLEKLKSPS